ncbi:NAD(P)-dependent oxidoreductase [Ruania alba]|uniref:D-3-phosphoglycerate dehydrogenase n=1 Tax=Ruania alba TaxID=648782 RepID=A0A1H5DM61_9MICO|nr:NAD(P)-dependent oxidoreductase [Ruania alba]SED79878.1 D-3-phosphoglycerate dehydrogenase [Ruania alba]
MATILVTSRSFGSGNRALADELTAAGHRIVRAGSDHDLDALTGHLAHADAWIAGTGPVTAAHLDAAPHLRVVARYGVGAESVDIEAATARGITVTNTPGANSAAVADHAVGLMLAALRGTAASDRRVRGGDWRTDRGSQLGTATVGIVGFGRIGRGVADRLSGFGSRVLVVDPFLTDSDLNELTSADAQSCTFEEMATRCDVLSLHAPGGQTLVDAAWLATVPGPMVLVNTARADLVDEPALAAALRDGRVRAYAADSLVGDTAATASPLLDPALANQVTVTAHVGAQTVEAVDAMGTMAVDNTLAVLTGTVPPHPLNTFDPDEGHTERSR